MKDVITFFIASYFLFQSMGESKTMSFCEYLNSKKNDKPINLPKEIEEVCLVNEKFHKGELKVIR